MLFPSALESHGFSILPIQAGHLHRYHTLPLHHRDPFDRLMIAQALVEGMTIVGCDEVFDDYGVARIR